jgi:hypothetical protein
MRELETDGIVTASRNTAETMSAAATGRNRRCETGVIIDLLDVRYR